MIIWISSYPKSGTTYLRSFLSAYYFSEDGEFNFNLLKNIKQFPNKNFFSNKLNSFEDAVKNYVPAQKSIFESKKANFLKTHNLLGFYKGYPFTIPEYTLGAIYIVRDPRNVITSILYHYSKNNNHIIKENTSLKEFKDSMNNLGLDEPKKMHIAIPLNMKCGKD